MSDEVEELGRPAPHFVQIVTAQWEQDDRKLTFSTMALGDDGVVYRYERGLGGWAALPKRVLSAKAIQKIKAAKYDSRGLPKV